MFRRISWQLRAGIVGPILLSSPHMWTLAVILVILPVVYYRFSFPSNDTIPWLWRYGLFEFRYNLVGSLFLMPFCYAAVVFGWRGASLVWALSMAVMLPRILYLSLSPVALAMNMSYALLPLATITLVRLELLWRQQERKLLAEREAERQVFMSQVLKAQEDERQRISRELHDDTMQTLLVVANRAQTLAAHSVPTDAVETRGHAEWIRDTSLRLVEDLRRITLDLRPSLLDDMGLVPALRWLLDGANLSSGVDAHLVTEGQIRRLKPETEINVFRIVQEAVNNVRLHSEATGVCVKLEYDSEHLRVVVEDNGRGFVLPESIGSFTSVGRLGLAGIQERAKSLNGTLEIDSRAGAGTVISLEVQNP